MSRSSSRSRSRSYSPSRPPKTEKSEDEKSTKEPLVKEVPKNVQDENANNEKSIIDTKDRKLQDREVIIFLFIRLIKFGGIFSLILTLFLIRTFQYLLFIIDGNHHLTIITQFSSAYLLQKYYKKEPENKE